MISSFKEIFELLKAKGTKKKLVVAWGVDEHSINAVYQAAKMGFVEPTLVGDKKLIEEVCKKDNLDESVFSIIDNPKEIPAVAQAVAIVKAGEADFLMKGLCSTDKFMHAILNKELGLLPDKAVMSHVAVVENPMYNKLMIASDMAVIPAPDLSQKQAMTKISSMSPIPWGSILRKWHSSAAPSRCCLRYSHASTQPCLRRCATVDRSRGASGTAL